MDKIVTALLTGQRSVNVGGVEFKLKPLKRDTLKNKEREAEKRAEQLIKVLNS